jgi:hypothetical protein
VTRRVYSVVGSSGHQKRFWLVHVQGLYVRRRTAVRPAGRGVMVKVALAPVGPMVPFTITMDVLIGMLMRMLGGRLKPS